MTRKRNRPRAAGGNRIARRRFLAAVGGGTVAATAGCLDAFGGGNENVVLGEQEDGRESEHLPYPTYGDPFPTIELRDPIAETTVATDRPPYDDRTLVVTAFYAFCPAECLLLVRALAAVQTALLSNDVDDVSILSITFDPQRDTAEELESHGEMMGVDLEAGNWHYLRPEDEAAAESVVDGDLGIGYQREGGTDGFYDFIHQTITFLVNPDRYVERVYHADAPDPERVSTDAETVATAYR